MRATEPAPSGRDVLVGVAVLVIVAAPLTVAAHVAVGVQVEVVYGALSLGRIGVP